MRQRTPPWEIILFWTHVTSVFQGLSLSRSVGRVGENPGNEVDDDTVRWAAITAGHFLTLYAVESTVLSRDLFDPSFHLLWYTFTSLSSGTEYLSLGLIKSWTDQRRQGLTLYTAHSGRSVCAGCAMKKNLALHHRRGIVDKATTLLFHLSDRRPVSKISLVSFISHLLR